MVRNGYVEEKGREYVVGNKGFGNMCFNLKMLEQVPHVITWIFKSNYGTTGKKTCIREL